MARVQKIDRGVNTRLDEFEQRMFLLKINYEKFFSGIDKIEPTRERELLHRMLRDLMNEPIRAASQRLRLENLKARMGSYEYYWTRQLRMMEQGTHPRQKFKAKLRERERKELLDMERQLRAREAKRKKSAREEQAFQAVYDRYIALRGKCGQNTGVSYEAVRQALQKQSSSIKQRTNCKSIKFRVVEEDGKAIVKAIPVN